MGVSKYLFSLVCFSPLVLSATDVANELELNNAIITANGGGDQTINFTSNITLVGAGFPGANLRPLNTTDTFTAAGQNLIVEGNGFTLNGAGSFRGFFAFHGAGSITINDLVFNNCNGRGGSSPATGAICGRGGGGAGLGGALFVGGATGGTLTLVNPTFTNSVATGGSSSPNLASTFRVGSTGGGGFGGNSGGHLGNPLSPSGNGGGGFNGNSGSMQASTTDGATGGGGALTSPNSINSVAGRPGGNAFNIAGGGLGGNGGGAATDGSPGLSGAGGGGGGAATGGDGGSGGLGGFGGGGGGGGGLTFAQPDAATDGGDGGNGGSFGGGGGGGLNNPSATGGANTTISGNGGNGGFAGGGGGGGPVAQPGSNFIAGNGGTGGFGAGGGGGGSGGSNGVPGTGGAGGFGGGAGGNPGTNFFAAGGLGGGGAGFGGALFLQSGASLVIQGSATFSGNSTAGGTGANAGSAMGSDIFMMSSSELTFDISSDVALPTAIEGDQGAGGGSTATGGLIKNGSGMLTLTGTNTYTGTTTVNAGELRLNSSIITNTTVNSGAMLSGNFTIASPGGDLTNSGIVSPGVNGVGTINIEGDYIQTASGTFLVDITPDGLSDRLFMDVSNQATLDGTLDIVVGPGNYIEGTTYEIINAPVTGVFATVVQSGPLAGEINIQVDYSSVVLTVLSDRVFVDQIIDPGVPSEVRKSFTSVAIPPGSDFATMTELLGMLSNSAVNSALITLSPVTFGSLEWINARNNSYVADLLSQHLFELCCSPRDCCSCDCNSSVWVNVFGNIMDNTKTLDNLRPFDANAVGALAGADFCCNSFYYGASVGYTHTHLILTNNKGKGNLDSYYGALYGSWKCNCFSIDCSVIGGATDQHLQRKIIFTGVNRTAKSDPWAYFVTGHLGLKTKWDQGLTTFEPFALGDYHYYTREGFKEKGANSLNLKVRSKDQTMIRAEAGLRAYSNAMSECYCVAPYLGLSWVGEFPLRASKQKAFFINQDSLMNTESYHSSVQLISPQGGFKWTCCDGASLTLGYKGLFNKRTRINQVEGRFEWIF